jgi:hypothetical protein
MAGIAMDDVASTNRKILFLKAVTTEYKSSMSVMVLRRIDTAAIGSSKG